MEGLSDERLGGGAACAEAALRGADLAGGGLHSQLFEPVKGLPAKARGM